MALYIKRTEGEVLMEQEGISLCGLDGCLSGCPPSSHIPQFRDAQLCNMSTNWPIYTFWRLTGGFFSCIDCIAGLEH